MTKYHVRNCEAYIGQTNTHGVWIDEQCGGGWRVRMVDRATGDTSTKPHKYTTFHSAVRAARRLIPDKA